MTSLFKTKNGSSSAHKYSRARANGPATGTIPIIRKMKIAYQFRGVVLRVRVIF